MAIAETRSAIVAEPWAAPKWPVGPVDPADAFLAYNPLADELVVRFGGTAGRRSVVVSIETPDKQDINVMSDEETGVVIGIQIDNLQFSVVADHAAWRALAEPEPPVEVVADLIVEVKRLFDRYGAGETPPARSR